MARILVVDEDPLMGELCREILAGEGHQVEVTRGGAELDPVLRRQRFDVVLLDPGPHARSVRGLHALVRQVSMRCPWIVLHPELPSPRLRKVAGRLGVQGVLPRGGRVHELVLAVQAAVEHRPWPALPAPSEADQKWSQAIDAVLPASTSLSESWSVLRLLGTGLTPG